MYTHQYLHTTFGHHAIYKKSLSIVFIPEMLKYWVGVQQGPSLTSWGEGASLALNGDPCSDGVNKNALWGRCFTSISFALHLFLLRSLKLNLALLGQLRLT